MSPLALGLDLGSSGLRLALAEPTPGGGAQLLSEESAPYPRPFADPLGWREGLMELVSRLDPDQRSRVEAIAIAGTSGTLLICRPDGTPLQGDAALALPYHQSCPEQSEMALQLCGDPASPAASASGSLARALRLMAMAKQAGSSQGSPGGLGDQAADPPAVRPASAGMSAEGEPQTSPAELLPTGRLQTIVPPAARSGALQRNRSPGSGDSSDPAAPATTLPAAGSAPPHDTNRTQPRHAAFLLRHQADWLMGWLLGDMRWGEEGNNIRLGWDLRHQSWSGSIAQQAWAAALPRIRPSGIVLGCLHPAVAAELGLPTSCQVVAGSTDANAGVLAADPREGDGVTVLGTTLVLKQFVKAPISAPGVNCHRVEGRWLLGGASNAGGGILRRFYSDAQIAELSRQIDPRRPTGLDLLPLPARGERFPVDDPDLEPRLGPRPISDALYLQALLEGLTELERRGWQRLAALGAPPVRRVLTLGGGARNPQWRMLRQQALGVPVLQRPDCSAALGMATLALRAAGRMGTTAEADR